MAGEIMYVGDDDIVGDDEIIGLDEDELGADESEALREVLGADNRRRVVRRPQQQQGRRVVQRERSNEPLKTQPLPIPATAFLANQSQDITLQPQRTIRIERPLFGSSIASFFALNDLKINQNSQFVGPGSIPCEAFTEVATAVQLKGDTARPGSLIVLSIENVTADPHTLRGMLIGSVIA